MRAADPFEPEVEAALEAIDATLAGDPVDPGHAELAELALILRADRPAVAEPFAVAMDARVRDRFAVPARRRAWPWRRPARRWLVWAPAGALAAVALVVAVVTLVPGGGSSSNDLAASTPAAASAVRAPSTRSSSSLVVVGRLRLRGLLGRELHHERRCDRRPTDRAQRRQPTGRAIFAAGPLDPTGEGRRRRPAGVRRRRLREGLRRQFHRHRHRQPGLRRQLLAERAEREPAGDADRAGAAARCDRRLQHQLKP